MKKRILAALAGAAVLATMFAGSVGGATPTSSSVGPTATTASWQGHYYDAAANVGGATGDAVPCTPAALDPLDALCDHFKVTVNADASHWNTNSGGLSVTITWASADNDFDLFIYDANENLVDGSAQGSTTFEQAFVPLATGTYEVRVVPFAVVQSGYSGTADFVSQAGIPSVPAGGPQAYNGVAVSGANPEAAPQSTPVSVSRKSMLQFQTREIGRQAAEPTIGVNKNGTAFYAAGAFDSQVGVPGVARTARTVIMRSRDGGLTWQPATPTVSGTEYHLTSLDPYVLVEPDSGRVFDIDLAGAGSLLSFSDNEGETYMPTALSTPGVNDHQTLWASVPPVKAPLVQPLDPFFPKVLYYCVNQVSDAGCVRSVNGGLTFTPTATPAYMEPVTTTPLAICSSLHGHGTGDSQGRIFLPRGCNVPELAISEDGGDTWKVVKVSTTIGAKDTQTSVAVDKADNVYYAWWDDKHSLPWLSVSRDHGNTWSTPIMIAPPGVHEVNWPTVIAGEAGKIAITFPGTTVDDNSDLTRPWNGYVVVSNNALDANPLFQSNIVNPASDPIHRGDCPDRCGRMYDFLDAVSAPTDGAVWATFVDTCTSTDWDGNVTNCSTTRGVGFNAGTGSHGVSADMRGLAARQIAGPTLTTPVCPPKKKRC